MTVDELNAYLHAHIPLSVHMGMQVVYLQSDCLQVHMPLAPNRNPHGTVFGGSLAALGLASGWMLLHTALTRAGVAARLVGKQAECEFLAPATGTCVAEARCEAIDALLSTLRERGRARQTVETCIRVEGIDVARHRAVYSALAI